MDAASGSEGKTYLERVRDGAIPLAPFVELLGLHLDEVADGHVTFSLMPSERLYNAVGLVHGGVAATLLDTAIGCAITTKMPPGRYAVTLDLQVRFFKPLLATSGRIRCEGSVINVGRTTATGEGRVIDESGRIHAHATSTCAVVDDLQRASGDAPAGQWPRRQR